MTTMREMYKVAPEDVNGVKNAISDIEMILFDRLLISAGEDIDVNTAKVVLNVVRDYGKKCGVFTEDEMPTVK